MAESHSPWLVLPRPARELPADLAVAIAFVVATNVAVLAPVVRETPLRIPLGLAFVLFVPGYAFVTALFPEAGESPTDDAFARETEADTDDPFWNRSLRTGIDGIERVALSFGLSIAIVPLIGLVLNFTPWGIRLVPIMVAVSGFTLASIAVAAHRRWQLPEDERFRVPYRTWVAAGRAELLEPDTRADAALNVLLVASILLALGSVGYAVTVPPEGERFSAIYLLTEDDDGDLIADDYPTEFELGESRELVVGVDNDEHRTVDYTVVVAEQEVETVDNETAVQEQRVLDTYEVTLSHNETWHYEYDLEPTMVGEDVRIVWLLYTDANSNDVPADPSTENTDYHVHLWVDVEEPG